MGNVFLSNITQVTTGLEDIFKSNDNDYIYMCGITNKIVMKHFFDYMEMYNYQGKIYTVLPSLTGSENIGVSFLYQINRLASGIRISNKAVHHIILTSNRAILISISNIKNNENQLCGVVMDNKEVLEDVYKYCNALWTEALPLNFGGRNNR